MRKEATAGNNGISILVALSYLVIVGVDEMLLRPHEALRQRYRALVWVIVVGCYFVFPTSYTLSPFTVALIPCFLVLVRLRRHPRWLARTALLVATPLLALQLGNMVIRVQIHLRPTKSVTGASGFMLPDPVLGYRPREGRVAVKKTIGDWVVFDSQYTIDEHGRRLIPVDIQNKGTQHLLLFGCSWTFGAGLNDTETIGAHLAKRVNNSVVYNYGCQGYGLQHVYAKIQSGTLASEVPERTGHLIYFALLPTHNDRLLGSYHSLSWLKDSPRFVLGQESRVERRGTFESSDRLRVHLLDVLRSSWTLHRGAERLERVLSTSQETDLFVRMITESRRLYLEQFSGRYIVCVWPQWHTPPQKMFADALLTRVRALGVEVVDLRGLVGKRSDFTIAGDGHPNGELHRAVSEALIGPIGRPH
ncbi:MAG: hypothetical protein JKY65_09205 [Planctomycetes bacterium]|nr:hypothetical protein [Planctomycetota bacterium]